MLEWIETALAIFGAAQVVVRATPTKKDDEITSKVGRILNILFSATRHK